MTKKDLCHIIEKLKKKKIYELQKYNWFLTIKLCFSSISCTK